MRRATRLSRRLSSNPNPNSQNPEPNFPNSSTMADDDEHEQQETILESDESSPNDRSFPNLSSKRSTKTNKRKTMTTISKNKKKKKIQSTKPKKIVAKKLESLKESLNPIPFSPPKSIRYFSKHESLFRKLGLWDFAALDFDREIRSDVLAFFLASYEKETRSSKINGLKIYVGRAEFSRALKIPLKKDRQEAGQESLSPEEVAVLKDFIMDWFHVNRDDADEIVQEIPSEITTTCRFLDSGEVEKVDWAHLMWSLAEKELKKSPALGKCYYASHFQMLVRSQRPEIFEAQPDPMPDSRVSESIQFNEEEDECEEVSEKEKGSLPIISAEEIAIDLNLDSPAQLDDKQEVSLGTPLPENGEMDLKNVEDSFEERDQQEFLLKEQERIAEPDNMIVDDSQEHYLRTCSSSMPIQIKEEDKFVAQFPNFDSLNSTEFMSGTMEPAIGFIPSSSNLNPEIGEFGADLLGLNQHSSIFGSKCDSEIANLTQNHNLQKKMRTDHREIHDDPPMDEFSVCMEEMHAVLAKAREIHMEKTCSLMSAHLHMQFLQEQARERDVIIEGLNSRNRRLEMELGRMKLELCASFELINGYKKALKASQDEFDEYRNRYPPTGEDDEPLYEDYGGGGCVFTKEEVKMLVLKEKEEKEAFKEWVKNEFVSVFGKECDVLQSLEEEVELIGKKLGEFEDQVKLLKECSFREKKVCLELED